ncbi:MAG: hypothetical protein KDB53_03775 [Planctomycetes bacterium]|nr:hypothetical protein [Planctomycetota bacterium]
MKIGLFGQGRLGRTIADIAGDAVSWQVTRELAPTETVDVGIEVSSGSVVSDRIEWALATRTPLVIGSTGWSIPDLAERVGDRIGVLVAPNFSLTVALYARLTRILGRFAAQDAARDPYVLEHHHARKHDAPSGTARQLAEILLATCPRKKRFVLPQPGQPVKADELCVSSIRAGTTYSSHVVGIDAPGEVIELHHSARSATPYAEGALSAARWIMDKKGVHVMDEVARELLDPLFHEGTHR